MRRQLGVKVINTLTNRVVKTYGKDEPFRALNIAMYQGQPQKKGVVTVSMAASANPLLQEAEERDPMLFATGFGKVRFYMFTNEEQISSKSERDVQNEKPRVIGSKKKEVKREERDMKGAKIVTFMLDTKKMGPGKYGIFDTFADENGRNAHLNGEIAKALFARAGDLLAKAPDISKPEILAVKP